MMSDEDDCQFYDGVASVLGYIRNKAYYYDNETLNSLIRELETNYDIKWREKMHGGYYYRRGDEDE
jgi:hypothetical protein